MKQPEPTSQRALGLERYSCCHINIQETPPPSPNSRSTGGPTPSPSPQASRKVAETPLVLILNSYDNESENRKEWKKSRRKVGAKEGLSWTTFRVPYMNNAFLQLGKIKRNHVVAIDIRLTRSYRNLSKKIGGLMSDLLRSLS